MMMRITLSFLALVLLGSGPCDMLLPDDTSAETLTEDGGPDGDPTTCTRAETINVIRADHRGFGAGFYTFALEFQDATSVSVECYYGHMETGLQCDTGDTHVLGALLGPDGATIQLILLAAPEWTLVTIEYNSIQIGRRALSPVYTAPAGNSCPEDCVYAETAMAVESW